MWPALIIGLLLLLIVSALLLLDGRAALSLLNAKEQVEQSKNKKILANVCFRLGVRTPRLFESSRYPDSVFIIQSLFHSGCLVVGTDLKKRFRDEELEVIFANVALRKKLKEFYLQVPLSALLILFNLPLYLCEKYRLSKLKSLVLSLWSPFNAIVAKVCLRRGLERKLEQLYLQNLGPHQSTKAIKSKMGSTINGSIYQALCLQPLSLQMFEFEDPLLDVLFTQDQRLHV